MRASSWLTLFESVSFSISDRHIIFESNNISILDEIYNKCNLSSYTERKIIEENKLYIDTNSSSWEEGCILNCFKTFDDLFYEVLRKEIPDFFLVCEKQYCSENKNKPEILTCIERFSILRKIVSKLADHVINNSEFLFFVNLDNKVKKYKLTISIAYDDLKYFKNAEEPISRLFNCVELDDAHSKERKEVMRSSLAEVVDKPHTCKDFMWIVHSLDEIEQKYSDNYDLYIRQFSVNKVLAEIEEKTSGYISKISDTISSIQVKAFAAPSSLIAITAFVRNIDIISLVVVAVGLYLIKNIIVTGNDVYRRLLTELSSQVEKSLNRYDVIREDGLVRERASAAKKELIFQINDAIKRINKINKITSFVVFIGVFYLLLKLFF